MSDDNSLYANPIFIAAVTSIIALGFWVFKDGWDLVAINSLWSMAILTSACIIAAIIRFKKPEQSDKYPYYRSRDTFEDLSKWAVWLVALASIVIFGVFAVIGMLTSIKVNYDYIFPFTLISIWVPLGISWAIVWREHNDIDNSFLISFFSNLITIIFAAALFGAGVSKLYFPVESYDLSTLIALIFVTLITAGLSYGSTKELIKRNMISSSRI